MNTTTTTSTTTQNSTGTIVVNGTLITGISVVRAGINFEDMGLYGDRDFNDIVLCFQGGFIVSSATVVSTAAQTVVGTFNKLSSCSHDLSITIINPDGTAQPSILLDDATTTAPLTLQFQRGSQLDVQMKSYTSPYSGDTGHPDLAGWHDIHDSTYAVVKPNVCNTTGR